MNTPRPGPWAERSRFGLALVLIAACFLWGGGSRLDIPGLIILQPLAILIGAALILIPGDMRWAAVRGPLFMLLALAVVMGIQLVPLPPAMWNALPGRDQFAPFVEAAGAANSWRPLSLTPDLTLASLVSLSVPAAGLVVIASLSEERTHQLLSYLLIAAALSAALGLGQIVSGSHNNVFYRYAITNEGAAVGLFANRNHQALLIAMTWPMLALWATYGRLDQHQKRLRLWIAGACALGLIPMVLVTGSRAGLGLAAVGIALAGGLLRAARRSHEAPLLPPRLRKVAPAIVILALVAVGSLAMLLSRDEAIQRLFATNLADEQRLEYLPVLVRIAGDFLPFGTGFGSFDPIYRFYETDALLKPNYLNHAHADWLELIITGGLPAVMIALVFLIWMVHRFWKVMARKSGATRDRFAYLGGGMIVLALMASTVDYPLRTPFHALLFVFAAAWLAAPGIDSRRRPAV